MESLRYLILYRSKTGYTKKIAEQIAQSLNTSCKDVRSVKLSELFSADVIIFGGSLHAAGIIGISTIKKNLLKLKTKKIILFATGVSPNSDAVRNEVLQNNFTQEQQKMFTFFYFRGGFHYKMLPLFDRFLMNLLKIKIMSKKRKGNELTVDEKGMLAIYNIPVDYTNPKQIEPLLTLLKDRNT